MDSSSLSPARLAAAQVTLANCADEAIHLPGHIQPHGALLVFNTEGRLSGWSANAAGLLQLAVPLSPALPLDALGLAPEAVLVVRACLHDISEGEAAPMMAATQIDGVRFDCIAHAHLGRVLLEFERCGQPATEVMRQVLMAQQMYDRLKRQKNITALLQFAVEQVRAMTGFDRVMAYRFRHDDSGEVVAEARLESWPPYLGQRYPASDIPAQARRLYIINTVRLIPDVGYVAVPMLGMAGDGAVDMSHGVLRSVSPVHVEYLQNMGVAASMSISILIDGRLWGMLACHHGSARHVPYAARMACDVLAQVLASTAQVLESRARTAHLATAAAVCEGLTASLLEEEDLAAVLPRHADALMDVFGAQALVLAQHGKLQCHGEVPPALAAAMLATLPQHSDKMLQRCARDDWPQAIHDALGKWVGLLALSFNPSGNGWLLLLRVEQIEAVRWGGKPEKIVRVGPLGPRLTPRGSFALWCETVHGRCDPWESWRLDAAIGLLAELHRVSLFAQVEADRVRALLLAMLGHDLRDPLHAIQMAATILQRDERQQVLARRIQSSGARMQRLISQVSELSLLRTSAAMQLKLCRVDLAALIIDLVDESRTTHASIEHLLDLPASCMVVLDADRIAQVISNLVSNALHHGACMRPLQVSLARRENSVVISVSNESAPISALAAGSMFDPFKISGLHNARNPGGMGLGLYIVQEIVKAHRGTITYHYDAPHVVFSVMLPASAHDVPARVSPG